MVEVAVNLPQFSGDVKPGYRVAVRAHNLITSVAPESALGIGHDVRAASEFIAERTTS